jgi:toxin ParE1/3/4
MKLRVTETAFAELNDIADYIARDNPTAAKAVVARIEEVFERIKDFPEIARVADASGIRIFPVRPFPYLVFYIIEQDEIIIRNVRHGARRRPDYGPELR